jgi:hypothetical protein
MLAKDVFQPIQIHAFRAHSFQRWNLELDVVIRSEVIQNCPRLFDFDLDTNCLSTCLSNYIRHCSVFCIVSYMFSWFSCSKYDELGRWSLSDLNRIRVFKCNVMVRKSTASSIDQDKIKILITIFVPKVQRYYWRPYIKIF